MSLLPIIIAELKFSPNRATLKVERDIRLNKSMKTITELNSKAWYRLLKVIYVLIFIPIFVLAFFSGSIATKPEIDNKKSFVKCDDGKVFTLEESVVFLRYGPYVDSIDNLTLIRKCSPASSFRPLVESYGGIQVDKNYELTIIYAQRNWPKTIVISFLSLIATIFVFELLKRIFYYIVLGSFIPPK